MTNPFEQYQAPKITKDADLNLIEKEKQEDMKRLAGHSFTTEKGSVYTYDDQGRTSRYKTKTKEQHESQDITVFVDISEEESRSILDAIYAENPDLKKKVYILERLEGGKPQIIHKFSEVNNPRNLYLSIYDKQGKNEWIKKASLKPTIGHTVFDTRHFENDDEEETERHLGHKVIEIN